MVRVSTEEMKKEATLNHPSIIDSFLSDEPKNKNCHIPDFTVHTGDENAPKRK